MISIIKGFKRLHRKIILFLLFAICITLLYPQIPVKAGVLQWTTVDTPGNAFNVIVSPSEINFLCAGPDSNTLYATDTSHGKVYRSADGGVTWEDVTTNLTSAGAAMPAWNIAIAPDSPGMVAIVTSVGGAPRNVFVSADGGNRWQNSNCTVTTNICAIDISMNYGNYDIAVGTRTGAGGGIVAVYKLAGTGSWANQGFSGDVLSARFSSNYATDNSLIIVSASAAGSFLNTGIRDQIANTTNWTTITPVEITMSGPGTSPKVNHLLTADIELPFDFSGQIASSRRAFVNLYDNGSSGNAGIYRVDNTTVYKLMATPPGKMISSISYYGSISTGKLLAGEVKANASLATTDIWICFNPGANCPLATCISWDKAVKPPTGGANSGYGNAQVIWSRDGVRAYCGTSSAKHDSSVWPNGYLNSEGFDESAFSLSLDNGKSWNQLSLIDTEITFLADVAASPGSDSVYLSSINTHAGLNGFDSFWRSTSNPIGRSWERILCTLVSSNASFIRINASRPGSIFVAARSTSNMYQSQDNGQTWTTPLPGVNITDFAVANINGLPTLYVLDNDYIRIGTGNESQWRWGTKISTTLSSGHSITTAPGGIIVVGDAGQGMVAYSIDNGMQFGRLQPVTIPGNMYAIVDERISSHLVIYAASNGPGGKLYSTVVGSTPAWVSMDAPDLNFYGLTQTGTLYGIWSTGGNSGVDRTLNPESLGSPSIEWDRLTSNLTPGVIFTREPIAIKSSLCNIWAIDNRPYTSTTGRLWNFGDCLSPVIGSSAPQGINRETLLQAPVPVSPAMNTVLAIDGNSNKINDLEFAWRYPTPANGYDLWIAEDSEFNHIVLQQYIIPENVMAPSWNLSSDNTPLKEGKTYFWKVRVSKDALYVRNIGPWSQVSTFNVAASRQVPDIPKSGPSPITPLQNAINVNLSPSFAWTPLSEAVEYEIILYGDSSLKQVVARITSQNNAYEYAQALEPGTTYYWNVRTTKPSVSSPGATFSFTTIAGEVTPRQTQQPFFIFTWLWVVIAALIIGMIIATLIIIKNRNKF